jgi:PAS domain S-box-containing protein
MKLNLTLAQKVFVLVLLPLTFQIVFVATLANILVQMERENAQEAHAKDLQSEVNMILRLIVDSGARLVVSEFAKGEGISEKKQTKLKGRAIDEFEALKRLVKGHPDEEAEVEKMEQLHFEIKDILKNAKRHQHDDDKIGLVSDFAQLQVMMNRFSACTEGIIENQQKIQRVKRRAAMKARATIINLLYFGVIFNIALAIGLALYFNIGVSRRLGVLIDNTKRMVRGQALNPPVGGKDEIAHLDLFFNKMAEGLKEAARKERAIIANASEVICSLDDQMCFSNANPAAEKIWGYSPEELAGKPLADFVPEDERARTKEQFLQVRGHENSVPVESRVQKKDGTEIEMLWSVQWSAAEQAYFCVAHDITDRKQIERMKREFVAMVSHDLRTPLTSIQGFLALLQAGALGELTQSGKSSLNLADNSINRLIKLVTDLLDMEKLESGKMDLHLRNVSVRELFLESAQAVDSFADASGVVVDIKATDLSIEADGDRIIQVLVNLVSNAIKFSPRDSVVTLSAAESEAAVEFRVSDEGRGIPPEFIDSVFERFKQVKKSDAKNRKGSGLGLAICKAIVEKHGGKIGVFSEEGKGSTFWFSLPKKLSLLSDLGSPEQVLSREA